MQSDEKADCAICAQSSCGVALKDETTTTAASKTKAADASSDVTANDNKPSDGDFTPMAVVFAAAGGGLLLGILATVVIMKMKNKK